MTEWMWRKRHSTEDWQAVSQPSNAASVPSLEHIRDIAEAAETLAGCSRPDIKTARTNAARLEVTFSDGSVVSMSDIFEDGAAHWVSELQ